MARSRPRRSPAQLFQLLQAPLYGFELTIWNICSRSTTRGGDAEDPLVCRVRAMSLEILLVSFGFWLWSPCLDNRAVHQIFVSLEGKIFRPVVRRIEEGRQSREVT